MTPIEQHKNYQKISKAIDYLSNNRGLQPSLSDVAGYVGLSEYHFQRLFSNWVGVSPKQFLMYLTKEYAKSRLQKSSVLQSALESGLSGSSRLHDLMVTCEGITPGEYKTLGAGLEISYGVHETPFAYCLIATTHRGVCKLSFFDDPLESDTYIQELMSEWSNAVIIRQQKDTEMLINRIFNQTGSDQTGPLNLYLKGTPFQLKVWQALLSIPSGELCSYQQVADLINAKSSVRAVASAIGKNNIAYLIPCHRVIKSTGGFNQYRWGASRKRVMITQEAALKLSDV